MINVLVEHCDAMLQVMIYYYCFTFKQKSEDISSTFRIQFKQIKFSLKFLKK